MNVSSLSAFHLPAALLAWVVLTLVCRSYALLVLPSVLLSSWYAALIVTGALGRRQPALPDASDPVSVSVLIPAHNESRVIERTLLGLTTQDHPDYEVIVVDDHSTDGTAALTSAWPVRTLTLSGGGPSGKSEALNAGLAIARGRVICVLDADARVEPDFLSRGTAVLSADPGLCAVQARLRIYNAEETFWTALQADELGILNDCVEAARTRLGGATRVLGNGQFVRREALEALGGWQPGLVDDLDLTLRLVLGGHGRIATAAGAVVWQEAVPTLGALVRQRARWFEGHLQTAGAYVLPVARGTMSLFLKADLLLCLSSVLVPLLGVVGLAAGLLASRPDYMVDPAAAVLHGGLSTVLFLAGMGAVGAACRRVEGSWRWRPAFAYALLMPVFLLAVARALLTLAGGGAGRWDKTARSAQPLESRS